MRAANCAVRTGCSHIERARESSTGDDTDNFFLVLEGTLVIEMRDPAADGPRAYGFRSNVESSLQSRGRAAASVARYLIPQFALSTVPVSLPRALVSLSWEHIDPSVLTPYQMLVSGSVFCGALSLPVTAATLLS